MNLFFEESGDFKAGAVLSQAGRGLPGRTAERQAHQGQAQGRAAAVRHADAGRAAGRRAPGMAAEVDLDFLWEVAGQEEFGFRRAGRRVFRPRAAAARSGRPGADAAFGAPIYFYKKGRGRYKAAPEAVAEGRAGRHRKEEAAGAGAGRLCRRAEGRHACPTRCRPLATQLLFKPDKNSIEYKALDAAASELQTTPQRLMLAAGGIASPKELHMARFLFENFPRAPAFRAVAVPAAPRRCRWPRSRHSRSTTSPPPRSTTRFRSCTLDDGTGAGRHPHRRAGPGHRAATTRSTRSRAARMSTVYMPGDKITMLPDEVVNAFTLAEGKTCPALSLYADARPGRLARGLHRDPRRSGADRQRTCATTTSTRWSTKKPWQRAPANIRTRTRSALLWQWAQALEAGPHGQARGVRPQARAEQPRRLQFLCRGRRRHDRAPQARRAAGQDRRRADDLRQQHLGQADA